jgi:gliding motility-associated-like protein
LVPTTQPGGIWSGPGVSVLAGNYAFDPSNAGVGTHAIVYTIFDGTTCETHDTLVYKVFPMPSVNAGIDQQMCSGDTIPISGIGSLGTLPYQFAWTPITGILSGSSTATASVRLLNNTPSDIIQSYTLTLTDSAGCVASDITDITIHPLPVVNAGLNFTLCNQPIAFTLTGYSPTTGGTGIWTGSPNLSGTIYTPTGLANGLGNQTLTYTFTDLNGCVNSDQVLLTTVAPVFPNAGLDIETCISDAPLTLIPTTLAGGIWSGAGVSQQGSDYLFSPSQAGEGIFTINYTVFTGTTCETKDSIEVTVFPLPDVTLGPDIDLCVDAPCYQITDFLPNNGNGIVPTTGLFFGEGSVSNTGLFCPQLNTPGDYKIYYQFTDPITTCINLDSMIIRVHPLPIPQFTLDSVICVNAVFNPINTSIGDTIYGGGLVYQWRVLDYLQLEYASYLGSSPNISIADTGNFIIELTITTEAGCVNQFQRSVFIIDIPVPAFSLSANSGCAPLSIDITNLSTGNYPDYAWTVNGVYQDSTSTPQAITFPSPVLGDTIYFVQLNISNQCGANDYQKEFLARPTPVAIPLANAYSGCSPFVPVFTNASYGAPDTYQWIFSDGLISADTVPVGHGFIAIDNDTTFYTVTLIAENACGTDTSVIDLIVLPNRVVSFFNTVPQFGCAPLSVQFTNFSSGANSYIWNFDDSIPDVTTYNATHVFQLGGVYNVSLVATDGCSSDTSYATVRAFEKPDIEFSVVEDVICQGNILEVSNLSRGAVAYLWSFGNAETSASIEPDYTYNQPGNFIVRLIGYSPVFGCPDTMSLPIEVRATPQFNIAVDPMIGCMPLHVNFTNNTLYTSGMEWDFGNGMNSTSFNPSTNYYQHGEYLVNVIAHNYSFASNLDCPVDTQIVISVFPKPESSFTLSSSASCGDSASVNVDNQSNGAVSYLWSWQASNSFEFEPLITLSDTGYFPIKLVVSNQFSCADTAIQSYRLTGQPTPVFQVDPEVGCMPLDADFSSLTIYGDAWEWDFGDGNTSTQGPQTNHEYLLAGNYTVSLLVSNDNACFADTSISQLVIVHPRAVAAFSIDPASISADYPVVLFENQSSNATSFDLYPGDGSHYTNFINQHIYQGVDEWSIESEVEIILIANNEFNCPDTTIKLLKIEPSHAVYIPSAFTPNRDGKNEFFGPEFTGNITIFNFLIFDRWGHIVFETLDKNVKWDGTFKNQGKEPIKQDVYVYKIVYAFKGSVESENLIGNVTVIY